MEPIHQIFLLLSRLEQVEQDYLYSLLNGYKEFPEDYEASEGDVLQYILPGNQIAMPSPIEDDIVEYDDGTEATHTQIAKDVTAF